MYPGRFAAGRATIEADRSCCTHVLGAYTAGFPHRLSAIPRAACSCSLPHHQCQAAHFSAASAQTEQQQHIDVNNFAHAQYIATSLVVNDAPHSRSCSTRRPLSALDSAYCVYVYLRFILVPSCDTTGRSDKSFRRTAFPAPAATEHSTDP